jgi:hypothetical protein
VSYTRMINARGKEILLFGDFHFSSTNECKKCKNGGCIHLRDYIKKMIMRDDPNDPVDFFIETAFLPKTNITKSLSNVKESRYNKYIGEIAYSIGECLVPHKSGVCKRLYPNSRMHYMDTRSQEPFTQVTSIIRNLSRDIAAVLEKILNNINDITLIENIDKKYTNVMEHDAIGQFTSFIVSSKKNFKNFIQILYKSKNPYDEIKKFVKIDKKLIDIMYNYNNNKSILHGETKYTKQLKKVPQYADDIIEFNEAILDKFYNNFNFSRCKEYTHLMNMRELVENIITRPPVKQKQFIRQAIVDLEQLHILMLDTGVNLMDIYSLARMIYYNENNNSNIIAFAGDEHVTNYRNFFKKIGYAKIVKASLVDKIDKSQPLETDNVNRCK